MIKRIMITGANSGLGKDSARQLALRDETEKIYIVARNGGRAEAAVKDLAAATGRDIFEIIIMDTMDLDSARAAAKAIEAPIDALIMNAGGLGGSTPDAKTKDGVTHMFAVNVLGHVVLLESLLQANKLTQVAMFAGSEAARGIPIMRMPRPNLRTSSADEFASIADGSFASNYDAQQDYGLVKYVGAMWMAALARKHPNVRFVTMSPGGTSGTAAIGDAPAVMKFMVNRVLPAFGMMHALEVGAKRYVNALIDTNYKSGVFYASRSGMTGEVGDQSSFLPELKNEAYQDNAYEAIHRFIKQAAVAG
jgi:NAD(P)-dependent dehydrogenase (short-subunit alcohol dehydrogenase family)